MSVTINEFAKKAYKYYLSVGMTPEGACGLMGNQYYESDGFVASRVEYLCLKRLSENGKYYTQDTYYKAVDSGKISRAEFLNPLPNKVFGFGICQWTSPPVPRKSELYDRTVAKGKSIADEDAQLEYTVYELKKRYPSVWKILTTTSSVKTASDTVLRDFEVPAYWESQSQTRYQMAKEYYDYFKTTKPTVVVKKGDNNTMTKTEKAIQWMENLAKDDSHGYDQTYRWGEKGDYDCSSATITAWEKAGVPVKSNGATYTGNMYSVFTKLGFKDVTSKVNLSTGAGLQRGDVLLNHVHHVAMYCGNGKEVEASINEYGGANGGKPGDQTGAEVLIRNYRNYPWDAVLRYPEAAASTSSSTTTASTSTKWVGTVNKASAPVRKWAGSEYDEVSFSPLKKGTKVEYQYTVKDNKKEDWYFVKVGDKYGFIYYKWVTKTEATKSNTSAKPSSKTQFRVQAGAYSVEANAKAVVKTLKKCGFDAIVIKSGSVYIVQVGMFESLNNANTLRDKLEADGFEVAIISIKN